MLSAVILSVVMFSAVMLSGVMLSAVMLSAVICNPSTFSVKVFYKQLFWLFNMYPIVVRATTYFPSSLTRLHVTGQQVFERSGAHWFGDGASAQIALCPLGQFYSPTCTRPAAVLDNDVDSMTK